MAKTKTNELSFEFHALPLAKFGRSGCELVAEMSDFGPLRDGRPWLRRIYNDACDIGIAIRSHYTGRIVRFYLEKEEVRDGDLLALHFKPLDNAGAITGVTIFND